MGLARGAGVTTTRSSGFDTAWWGRRGAVDRRRGHPIPIAPDGARRGYIRALRRTTNSAR